MLSIFIADEYTRIGTATPAKSSTTICILKGPPRILYTFAFQMASWYKKKYFMHQ